MADTAAISQPNFFRQSKTNSVFFKEKKSAPKLRALTFVGNVFRGDVLDIFEQIAEFSAAWQQWLEAGKVSPNTLVTLIYSTSLAFSETAVGDVTTLLKPL